MFAALSDRVLSLSNGVTEFLVGKDVQCVATGLAETLLEHGVAELISREHELLDRYA